MCIFISELSLKLYVFGGYETSFTGFLRKVKHSFTLFLMNYVKSLCKMIKTDETMG